MGTCQLIRVSFRLLATVDIRLAPMSRCSGGPRSRLPIDKETIYYSYYWFQLPLALSWPLIPHPNEREIHQMLK